MEAYKQFFLFIRSIVVMDMVMEIARDYYDPLRLVDLSSFAYLCQNLGKTGKIPEGVFAEATHNIVKGAAATKVFYAQPNDKASYFALFDNSTVYPIVAKDDKTVGVLLNIQGFLSAKGSRPRYIVESLEVETELTTKENDKVKSYQITIYELNVNNYAEYHRVREETFKKCLMNGC